MIFFLLLFISVPKSPASGSVEIIHSDKLENITKIAILIDFMNLLALAYKLPVFFSPFKSTKLNLTCSAKFDYQMSAPVCKHQQSALTCSRWQFFCTISYAKLIKYSIPLEFAFKLLPVFQIWQTDRCYLSIQSSSGQLSESAETLAD